MHPSTARRLPMLLLLLLAAPAAAAPGIRLSWDHCSADGRVANKNFACNTNTGTETMVVSYEAPLARTDRLGVEITMEVFASDPVALPAWWLLFNAGSCRSTSLSANVADPGLSACVDPYGSIGAAGVGAYQVGKWTPNSAQLLIAAAVPATDSFAVGPGIETFAVRVVVNHAKTLGPGACAGCTQPVCIGVGSVNLTSANSIDNIAMVASGPNEGGGLMNVTWQGAYVTRFTYAGGPALGFIDLVCAPTTPVPTRARTWGQLRSLYR